ncbi:MAG: LPS-assembly protein LptD, partial [Gammaproteobacteria bacterium]
RIHATPSIIYPWVNPWGLISARADLFTTAYQLENLNGTVIRDPSVVAPMFSVDSTVIFERDYEWGEDSRLTHTIEPQAKLTYIPWADHSNLPVFDSNVPQATRANLKRINRFTGADRVGDTFKLAAGFDTRILDAGGIQRIKLGSTQVFYFDDRSVQRSARAFQDGTEYSEIATDFVMDLNDQWAADGELVWDPDRGDTVANRFDIRYRRDVDHVFDIGYRYRRRSFEHITASTRWLLTPGWTLFAGFDYSPRNDDFIDNIFGIEYDDCCLTVRVAFRDYKLLPQASAQNDEESEISLGIQIELKGFNFVGTNLEAEQMERIPGVRSYDL